MHQQKIILVADYSQIELRVAALVSGDEIMLEAYEKGLDLHRNTAAKISEVPFDQVTREQRQAAKAINFGLLYGQGHKGLARYAKANYGVSMSEQKAMKAKKAFFRTYKGLARWQKKVGRLSKLENKIITPGGRVRDFKKEKKDYHYTEALNTPIQGGAAEVMLATLARLEENMKGVDGKLVNMIHDELVMEVNREDVDVAKAGIEEAMLEGMLHIFPEASTKNLVEINVGANWAEAK